jgi:hypothetical protein
MDWKKTFNQGQWFTHAAFLLMAIITTAITLFALRLHHLQSTEEERSQKLNSLVEHLKKDQSFEKIGKYLSWAESDKAHDKIRELAQKIALVEEILEVQASSELNQSMKHFNQLISLSSAFSNPADALKLLRQKIAGLQDVARSQGYKNLGTIAERMKVRFEQLNGKNVGESALVNLLITDLRKMEQLIAASSLSEGEKSNLKSRFNSMGQELDLIARINSQSRDVKTHLNQASLALAQWVLDLERHSGDIVAHKIQKQKQLIILLSSLTALIVLSWLGIAYLLRWQAVKIGAQVEIEVKNVIERGILNDQRYILDHYSDRMRSDIVRLLDDLKLKLNLGSMLHEGLPFAGCMIDKNFKLTWFNQLFLEQLYLSEDEVRSDAFNWDYVRDYLNLSEDPIYQALVNKIAGIFPVKVKQDEMTPSQPYEMYVTPISVNREDRVMVFFYPLISINDAIKEQLQLTRKPLEQFLSLWNEEQVNADDITLLAHQFKHNDMTDMYQTLVTLHERITREKQECYITINQLEQQNLQSAQQLEQMRELDLEQQRLVRKELNLTRDLRQSFISCLERSEALIQINKTVMQNNDELKSEAQKLQQTSGDFIRKSKETADIMSQLDGVRIDYKKLKLELLEVKAKLISMNNSLLGQLPVLDEQQQKMATRYKDELARLDFNVFTLDKKLSQLDVLLAKLQMMHDRNQPVGEQTIFSFLTSQKDHELREALMEAQKSLGAEEGKIIDCFKQLHSLMKQELLLTQSHQSGTAHVQDSILS